MATSYRAQGAVNGHNVAARSHDGAALVGRVLIALLFIWSGWGKLTGFGGAVGYISSVGLPMPQVLAVLAIIVELGGGILLLLGLWTRWVALAYVVFLIVITPVFHAWWSSPEAQVVAQQINFGKNVAIAGGLLLLFAFGPGRYSMDRR